MKYNTFKGLTMSFALISLRHPERKVPLNLSQMDQLLQMSDLPVQFVGLLVALCMTL